MNIYKLVKHSGVHCLGCDVLFFRHRLWLVVFLHCFNVSDGTNLVSLGANLEVCYLIPPCWVSLLNFNRRKWRPSLRNRNVNVVRSLDCWLSPIENYENRKWNYFEVNAKHSCYSCDAVMKQSGYYRWSPIGGMTTICYINDHCI